MAYHDQGLCKEYVKYALSFAKLKLVLVYHHYCNYSPPRMEKPPEEITSLFPHPLTHERYEHPNRQVALD